MIEWDTLAGRLDGDAEFRVAARLWTATVRLDVGSDSRCLRIEDGRAVGVTRATRESRCDLFVSAPAEVWDRMLAAVPAAFHQDLFAASLHHGLQLNADYLDFAPWYPALRRMLEVLREARHPLASAKQSSVEMASAKQTSVEMASAHQPSVEMASAKQTGVPSASAKQPSVPMLDRAVGRYVHLVIDGVDHRVYFEESGAGIPLVLQHTAGADGRQWRHLLEDEEITRDFRVIAYDLPYHGKSLPPTTRPWWTEEYRLTRDFLMQVPLALAAALGLERPVFMGSSIGGHLALDLARYHPESFRAVISLEGADHTPGSWLDIWNHPQVSNAFKANVMYGLMSPTSPAEFRHETIWGYSQGAPPTFKGDLYYHGVDHDLSTELERIDTSKVAVHMLTGEYDFNTTPEMSRATAARIAGATFTEMKGLGHFPMSENPARFREYLLPVLARIRRQAGAASQGSRRDSAD